MSRNDGKFNKSRQQNGAGKSYGIFGDAIGSLKQKLSFDGFEKEETRIESRSNFHESRREEGRREQRREVRPNVRSVLPANPRNFFVFGIETTPCIETARSFLKIGAEVSDDEVIAKLTAHHGENEFLRQLFHKIVCVSFIFGTIHTFKGGKEKYVIKNIKTEGRNGESEEEILRNVFSHLARYSSRLISFNGRGFDMPVLQYRAMKYGIDAKWIYSDGYYNYNHRYSIEKHCDLLEMFSNFGASARVKMSEVCALFKIPCKNGVESSNIQDLFKAGKISEIADYCEIDVITTYVLYLRFMQHSGKLSAEGYNICLDNLCNMLKSEEGTSAQILFVESLMQMNAGNPHLTVEKGAVKQEEAEEIIEESFSELNSAEEYERNEDENEENQGKEGFTQENLEKNN